MPLQGQTVPINFGQGIDTKTDPKLVMEGKFILLKDAVMVNAKRATKRNGYTLLTSSIYGGGSLTAPKMVRSFQSELVCADSGRFYAYSPTLAKWVDKGKYLPIAVSTQAISAGIKDLSNSSSVQLGGYALYAWQTYSSTPSVVATAIDLTTGTVIMAETALSTLSGIATNLPQCPRCVVLGATSMAVVYLNDSSQLVMKILTINSSSATFGSEQVLATDICDSVGASSDFGTTGIQYDVVNSSTGCTVAYSVGGAIGGPQTDINIKTVNTSGAVTHTATINYVTPSCAPISIYNDSANGQNWLYWFDANLSTLYFAVYSSTLSVVLAKTLIRAALGVVRQIAILKTSTTAQTVYFSQTDIGTLGTGGSAGGQLYSIPVQSNGTIGSFNLTVLSGDIYSRIFTVNSVNYITLLTGMQTDMLLVVYDLSNGGVVAKFLLGEAGWRKYPSMIADPLVLSSTQVQLPVEFVNTFEFTAAGTYTATVRGVKTVLLDFNHQDAYQSQLIGGVLVLNGSVVSMYDGASVTELGFNYFPFITLAGAGAGGSMAAGTYQYIALYQWYDAQGNLHQSAPCVAQSVTTTGATSQVTLTISCIGLTQKTTYSPIQILIYRTTANGTTFRLVSPLAAVPTSGTTLLNSTASNTVTYVDKLADSSLTNATFPYTNGNVIENTTPPPSMLMAEFNDRLMLVDDEDKLTVWYSKSVQTGVGISMSDQLTFAVDRQGGNITGVSPMDEKFIVFKGELPFLVAGDGANDTGSGSTLTVPQPIPADTGCSQSKSIILTTDGIVFKSPKGIYLLDRSTSCRYMGFEVEAYNSQNIVQATYVKDKNQVRFLTDSGSTLMYDYAFNQWSVFTNHAGYSACIYGGLYTYARTDGTIFQENTTSFLDNATSYGIYAQTAWLKLASVQGFQRVWELELLGDYTNGSSASHAVRISAAYDFSSTFSTPVSYTFGDASASGPFQFRLKLARQKCDALCLLIEEVTNSVSGEFIDLTDLSLSVGIKKGLNKLPANKSVG